MNKIVKNSINRFSHYAEPYTYVSNRYFANLLIYKTYGELASSEQLKELSYFYETMKRLDPKDTMFIYEKYFKEANLSPSKNKNKNITKELIYAYVVIPLSSANHAKMLNISLAEYRKTLDEVLYRYIDTLVDVKREMEGGEKND